MSHTGYRVRIPNPYLGETGFIDPRPRQINTEDITKDAILDEQVLEGEFQGNGVTVLTGLSTSPDFDAIDILNDDEKGVIIGYVPSAPYFQLYRNDGTGPKVTTTFVDKFKDEAYHNFKISFTSTRLLISLDGADTEFTDRIPSLNDTFYVINYSIY